MTKQARDKLDPVSLAGWLFADLFLALIVVGLGSQTLSTVSSANNDSENAEVPRVLALDTKPIELTINVDGTGIKRGNVKAVNDLKRQIFRDSQVERAKTKQAGYVEVLSASSSSPCRGDTNLSSVINKYLRRWLSNSITASTVTKNRIIASCKGEKNHVEINIYLFV